MNAFFRQSFRASILLAVPAAAALILSLDSFGQNQAVGTGTAVGSPGAFIPFPTNTSQYRRWEWAFKQRTYPLNVIPPGTREQALAKIQELNRGRGPRNGGGSQWVNIGPAPIVNGQVTPTASVSGRVTCIAVNPNNSAHWIVGTGMGGVWETVNSGATWVPRTDDQPALAVGAVAFAPSNPSVMFAGTGEPNGSDSYAGAGLLRSTDGGQTWQVLGAAQFASTSITAVRVHPGNINHVVVATAPDRSFQLYGTGSSPVPPLPVNGVYLSTDGGTNWTRRLTGPVMALEASPANFANQYAAIADIGSGTVLSGGVQTLGAIHRSQDAGSSWTLLSGPWGNQTVVRIAIAISPSNPDTAYVCVAKNESSLVGFWRSDNAWSATPSWTALPTPSSAAKTNIGQLSYNLVVNVDPTNPSVVYFGEVAVWRYNGTSWTTLAGHYDPQFYGIKVHSDQHALAWSGSRLLVGNDGGVWSSTDSGNTFVSHNTTMSAIQFYHGSVHPSQNFALGGEQDNGSAKWTGASGWSFAGFGDGADNGISPNNPDTKWAVSNQKLTTVRVTGGGQNSEVMLVSANDFGLFPNAPFIGRLAFSPGDENVVISGTTRLLKCVSFFTAPAPQTIQQYNATWSYNGPEMNSYITALAFAKSDASGNTYAFGTANGELRLTTQGGGANWVNIDAGNNVPGRFVSQVAFNPQNANVLYVVLSGFDQNTPGKPGHVFKTVNALAASPTWANVSPPVNLPHNAIAIDPANPNNVYAGTDIGVWRSTDAGGSWAHMGPEVGMPNVAVYDLDIQAGSGRVFAFTHGRSAFMLDASAVTVPPTITSFSPTNGPPLTAVTIRGTKLSEVTAVRFNNVNATFTLGTATNLSATVPVGATTGPISVTSPSGTASSANNFVVTSGPNISGFSPSGGNIGTVVVITGANFTGATGVTFNGVAASFTVNSSTQITATVPSGAATGRIAVTTPSGAAQSAGNFTVNTTPVISAFNPTSGGVGASVIIQGANLTGATAVSFNNVAATGFTVNSAAQITATVPAGATTGLIRVTTPLGTGASANDFVVIPAPVISSFNPGNGVAEMNVNISGSNFTGATNVTFNNVVAKFTVNSATQITAEAPIGVTTGPLRVTTAGGTGVSALPFTVLPPPSNDNFATPQDISGSSGTTSGNNTAATKETGEPLHAGNQGGKSIWYRWTAPANGLWTFDTLGTGINTLLVVYTGNLVNSLSGVATNDDVAGGIVSRVTFSATGGTTYRIAIDGFRTEELEFGEGGDVAAGPVTLNWTLASNLPPVISSFSPGNGYVASSVVISGTNLFGATSVTLNNTEAAFTVESLARIVAVVPGGATSGLLRVTTPAGVATSAGNFTVLIGPGNDNFANASGISGTNGVVTGANEGGTPEAGEPQHAGRPGGRSVWYSWTAPANGTWRLNTHGSSFDTALAVYAGDSVNALSLVSSNDDSGALVTSELTFGAAAGAVYRLAVDGVNGAAGNIVLNWNYVLALPQISNFNPGIGPVGTVVSITGSNLAGATSVRFNGVSAGFTNNSSTLITATIPPGAATGPIQITTPNGIATSAGSFVVTTAPPNDNFVNAQLVVSNAVALGGNVGGTKESNEPSHAANTGGRSIWYRWVAPNTGTWKVDTIGSSFDTTLAVYTGNTVGGLSLVLSDDDSGGNRTSQVAFSAVAGTTYRIAVDGFNGESGNVVLRMASATLPATIYYTTFNPGFPEFYNVFGSLAGQNGWQVNGSGANGFVPDYVYALGYSAALGLSPTNATDTYLWVPINYTPDTNTRPVVTFSAYMQIVDSTYNRWDDFEWQVYNISGNRLFSLNFDNVNLGIFYQLSTGGYTNTGVSFQNGKLYQVFIIMDFARNRWSATLYDGVTYTTVVERQPITNSGLPRNLGDVDAVWLPRTATAGNNYMAFDEYLLYASPSLFPRIVQQPLSKTIASGASAILSVTATGAEPLSYEWRINGLPILGGTQPVLTLNNVTPGLAGNYSVVVSNSEGFVISSNAALAVSMPLADALDTINLNWTTDRDVGWFGQTVTTHDGVDAAQSGAAVDNQEAWMQVSVTGPGQLNFWWKVSSETNYDYLELYIDGVLQSGRISGEVNWQQKAYNLSEGQHTLRWRYAKDELVSTGQDRAWVDQVTLNLPPTIAAQPQSQTVDAGQSATFNVLANGSTPLAYQWRFGATNIVGAVASNYTRSNVQAAHAGNYSVVVTNAAGSVTSAVAVLTISAPRPTLFAPVVTSSNVVITWMSVSGRVYQLQYKDRLTNANWSPLMPNVTATGPVASKTDTPSGVQRYYRVQLTQ